MKEGIANDLNPTGFSYKDKGRLYSNQNWLDDSVVHVISPGDAWDYPEMPNPWLQWSRSC
jgi:hypothetical protein